MPANGGPARQLTHHTAQDTQPAWSPDGQEITFASSRGGNFIWTISADGGEARQVTTDPEVWMPIYSPDGKWILVGPAASVAGTLWRIPVEGGEAEPITEVKNAYVRWSADGKKLYFQRDGNFWVRSIEDGTEIPVTDFEGRWGFLGPDLAIDGQYLYFNWREDIGDIWVMDVVRE